MLWLSSADFLKLTFPKNSLRNTIRMSNGLDLDQDRHFSVLVLDLQSLMRYDFIHIDVFHIINVDVFFLTKSILPIKYFSSSIDQA